MKSLLAIILVLGVISFTSCNSKGKKDSNDSTFTEMKKETVEKEITEFVYPLPTSFELANMLNEIGAAYILSLSNPTENAGKYLTTKSKALNLGIYGADLSYASTYNQKQITMDYMSASNKLIEELEFSSALDEDIIAQIENSQEDKEKLVKIISNTFYKTYEYLNKNDRSEIALLIVSGSWIEGVYICTNISEDTFNDVNMIRIIMEQKDPLNKLLNLLNTFEGNDDIDEVIESLTKVKDIYDTMEEGSITSEQIKSITKEITKIRNSYTAA